MKKRVSRADKFGAKRESGLPSHEAERNDASAKVVQLREAGHRYEVQLRELERQFDAKAKELSAEFLSAVDKLNCEE